MELTDAGECRKGADQCRIIIAADPTFEAAHLALAAALSKLGNESDAVEALLAAARASQ